MRHLIAAAPALQVADFGLAKLTSDSSTHVSTRVMGTFGYLAPEYASSGKLTEKSDVFSYGVMLLELLTGRRPSGEDGGGAQADLPRWARAAVREEWASEVLDVELQRGRGAEDVELQHSIVAF